MIKEKSCGALVFRRDASDGKLYIVLIRHVHGRFFSFPKGHVEKGKSEKETAEREVFEETGVHYEIDRLAYIEENFFKRDDGAMKGLDCHEISFYFLMKSRGTQEIDSHSMTLNGTIEEKMCWLPIDQLDKVEAYPMFLREKLKDLKSYPEHVITKK